MSLSVTPKMVTFTANEAPQHRSHKDQVETAATVTGGVGAGAAATRGGAMRFFKTSAERLNHASRTATEVTQALEQPVKQSRSLFNALKLNYQGFKTQIVQWAEKSNLPKFVKPIFTGKVAGAIGGIAAVFVFITGTGEVISTAVQNVNKVKRNVDLDFNNMHQY